MAAIMRDFAKLKEHSLSDSKVQKQVETLQSYISEHFYPCDMEILSGLGQVYIEDNRFTALSIKRQVKGQLVLSVLPLQNMLKITDNL